MRRVGLSVTGRTRCARTSVYLLNRHFMVHERLSWEPRAAKNMGLTVFY
jgi:hypothetical protein